MELPAAYICHQAPRRLRIKITSRKGDAAYFDKIQEALTRFQAFEKLAVNSLTGSVLIIGAQVDAADIAEYAKAGNLFDLMDRSGSRPPVTTQLVSHLENLNTSLRRLTTGEIDLAGLVLLLLLIAGFTELLRGKIRMPPWYTAFWYAFGIYQVASVIKTKRPEEA